MTERNREEKLDFEAAATRPDTCLPVRMRDSAVEVTHAYFAAVKSDKAQRALEKKREKEAAAEKKPAKAKERKTRKPRKPKSGTEKLNRIKNNVAHGARGVHLTAFKRQQPPSDKVAKGGGHKEKGTPS